MKNWMFSFRPIPFCNRSWISLAFIGLVFIGCFANLNVFAGQDVCRASLPKKVASYIARHYKSWSLVTPQDLTADDRASWEKGHENLCPGVARADFVGARYQQTAVLLMTTTSKKSITSPASPATVQLVLFSDSSYGAPQVLVKQQADQVPVLFSEEASHYADRRQPGILIEVHHPIMVLETIDSSAVGYYYEGWGFKTIQLSE